MSKAMLLGACIMLLAGTAVFAAAGTETTEAKAVESVMAGSGEYNEHPLLAKMVEQGLIPPVDERLPENPRVVEPLHAVGTYGGTGRVFYTGDPNGSWDLQLYLGADSPFAVTPDGHPGAPQVFAGYEVTDDFTEWTFHLRRGLKWSDGHPLTTENFYQFWKYDRSNSFINPSIKEKNVTIDDNAVSFVNEPGAGLEVGRVVKKEVVDEFTLRYTSPEPYPNLVNMMSNGWMIESWIVPMHFKLQYHPDIVGEAEAKKRAEAAGFEEWHQLYSFLGRGYQSSVQRFGDFPPTIMSYVVTDKSDTRMVFERNPYYWTVDTARNQLPYIDRIIGEFVSELQMIDGKVISGESDFQALHTDTTKLPLYKQYEGRGGYRTEIWLNGANNPAMDINYSTDNEVMRELVRNKDFRIALSISVNRQRIVDEVYQGVGKGVRNTIMEGSEWYRPEFQTKYAEYDPAAAAAILDELGVVDQDGDGWRDDPEGRTIEWVIEYSVAHVGRSEPLEIVANGWQDIGLNVNIKEYDHSLFAQRGGTNDPVMRVWHKHNIVPQAFPIIYINSGFPQTGVSWYQWYVSEGSVGDEPPAEYKELIDVYYNKLGKAASAEDRIKWGLRVNEIRAENVWTIETVSYSPAPVIVAEDMRNFPTLEDGPLLFLWDTWWTNPYVPSQFYYENRPMVEESESKLFEYYEAQGGDWVQRAKEKGWL